MNRWAREWGAVAFVATVLLGALAVGGSLVFGGGVSRTSSYTLPPCPTVSKTTPTAANSSPAATAAATPAATFSAIYANCPTPSIAVVVPSGPAPSLVPSTPIPHATPLP